MGMLDVPIEPVVLSQDMFHLRNGAKQRLARKLVGRLCLTRWLLLSCSSLPHKRWLSAAEGGLMASGYAFGYMLAVPVLTTLTDRIDVRLVLLCGSILSGLATLGDLVHCRTWICGRPSRQRTGVLALAPENVDTDQAFSGVDQGQSFP
jgi:MFS family permease